VAVGAQTHYHEVVSIVVNPPSSPVRLLYRFWLVMFSATSLAGLLVSIWAHIVALLGGDPRAEFRWIWVLQIVLFALLLPIVVVLFREGVHSKLFRSPRWARVALYALLGYYAAHFYLFIYVASEELTNSETWRMFSSGWLLLFFQAAVYYWVRLQETRKGSPNSALPSSVQ
jgi:hypothetical protein